MDFIETGDLLRAARKRAGRSQADLARSLGMSRATISSIENGTVVEIGVKKLEAVCRAVGLDLFVAPRGRRPTLAELRRERRGASE